MNTPSNLRVLTFMCWLSAFVLSVFSGNYINAWIFSLNLAIGFIVIEANDGYIRRFLTYLIDSYHHRQVVKARRQRYSLFRQKVKSEPVDFEDEAKDVID